MNVSVLEDCTESILFSSYTLEGTVSSQSTSLDGLLVWG